MKIDYSEWTREDLIKRIDELEALNRELMKEKVAETRLEFAWSGNLGHWYFDLRNKMVTFNPLKMTTLGYDIDEIPESVEYQFFTEKLHPEDYENTMNAMLAHMQGRTEVYETEYRIMGKDGKYRWFYDRGRATQFDDQGKPVFIAGIVFDITEKKAMLEELENKNNKLEEISRIDGLTGIRNHKTLVEFIENELQDHVRNEKPLSIAIFDVDNFKEVNDNYGHIYGDSVLVNLSEILETNIRDTDMAGRYCGEEFMIVFTNADKATATKVAERIRRTVEETVFKDGLKITISGGVKQYEGENLIDFVHKADLNLYEAKTKGKNQIVS